MTKLHRVYGPPGCGKTSWVKRQAERAAGVYGADKVAIASLTRAAAEEVSSRVDGIPRRNVGTLHSLAYRGLEHPAILDTPEGLKEWNAHAPVAYRVASAARDDDGAFTAAELVGDPGGQLLADYARMRSSMTPRAAWPDAITGFAAAWEDFKRANQRVDFTDLIEQGADLDSAPGNPAVLMVDEAQDLSALEMRLVTRWADAAEQLVIVGDPDQNLYEWRGSNPAVFSEGEAASEHILEQSFRVPRRPQAYAVWWIERTPGRRPVPYLPRDEEGDVRRLHASYREPAAIVELAEREAAAGRTAMILAPCGFMLASTLDTLRARGVPFHNPYRTSHGGWNPMRGARRALALLRTKPEVWGDDVRHWTWRDVWAWAEPMRAEHFKRGAKAYIQTRLDSDQFGRSLADEPSDAAWLVDNLSEQAADAIGAGDLGWWLSSSLASWRPKLEYACEVARRQGAKSLRDEPRVVVGTIHSVKGGEADTVVVLPDLSPAGARQWMARGAGRAAVRRLFYVAFTRTRGTLVLARPATPSAAPLPEP